MLLLQNKQLVQIGNWRVEQLEKFTIAMIPYHGYDSPALVHHHTAYATNNNPVEQEVPKYAR